MELTNKAMYIKGLADGLGLDAASKEGKVIAALLELVNEMAGTIEEMQSKMRDLEDYVEELDEDLGDVEEVLVGDGDEDEDDDDDGFCNGDCENCNENCDDSDDSADDDDDDEHEHHHHHTATVGDHLNRAFLWGIGLNVAFVAAEATAGILYGSLGLLSDAGHNLSDVSALFWH